MSTQHEDPSAASCGCEADDPDLVRLRSLMADGMGQWEASRLIWAPEPRVPALPAPAMAQLDPGRWAVGFVRHSLANRLPWLRLPSPTRQEAL